MATSRIAFLECHPRRAVLIEATLHAGTCTWGKGWSVNASPADPRQKTTHLLQTLAALTRYRGPVILLLPTSVLLVKTLRLPTLVGRRADAVRRFAASEAIPYPLDDVCWDCVPATEDNNGAQLLFAARTVDVENWCAAAESVGFDVESAWPAPLATFAAIRAHAAASTALELVLTLGADVHELWQINGTRRALRLLPANAGEVDSQRLADDLRRTIAHFAAVHGEEAKEPAVLWVIGGNETDESTRALAARLPFPVRKWNTNDAMPHPGKQLPAESIVRLQGAACLAGEPTQSRAELLPHARQKKMRRRCEAPWWIAAAMLGIAAMLPPVVRLRTQAEDTSAQSASLAREVAPMHAREAEYLAHAARLRALGAEIERIAGIERRRFEWLARLAELEARLAEVESVWLDRLEPKPRRKIDASAAESEANGARRYLLEGRMLERNRVAGAMGTETYARVSALRESLASSPVVAGVGEMRLERDPAGVLHFGCEIEMRKEMAIR